MLPRFPGLRAGTPIGSVPLGSPLDPNLAGPSPPPTDAPTINAPRPNRYMPDLSPAAPTVPVAASGLREMPKAPPSVRSKRPSIWDKEHISETLANIGSAFLSNEQSFGAGLGAAGQAMAQGSRQLRDEGRKSVSYGGPDDQFEIMTDPMTGERTVRQVPEFAAALEAQRNAKNAPSPKDNIDFRSRAIHAIGELPPEQRQAAYADLIANPGSYGVDTAGMPSAWSDQYGAVAGGLGLNVNQSLTQDYRRDVQGQRVVTDARRLDQRDRSLDQTDRRVSQGDARVAQGGGTGSSRGHTAPPVPTVHEGRRGRKAPVRFPPSRHLYGRFYLRGWRPQKSQQLEISNND